MLSLHRFYAYTRLGRQLFPYRPLSVSSKKMISIKHPLCAEEDGKIEEFNYDDFFGIEENLAYSKEEHMINKEENMASESKFKDGSFRKSESLTSKSYDEDNTNPSSDGLLSEKVFLMNFGSIRLDRMNKIIDTSTESCKTSPLVNFKDGQYFKKFTDGALDSYIELESVESGVTGGETFEEETELETLNDDIIEENLFDEQYFGETRFMAPSTAECDKLTDNKNITFQKQSHEETKLGLNFFDEQMQIESSWAARTPLARKSTRDMSETKSDVSVMDGVKKQYLPTKLTYNTLGDSRISNDNLNYFDERLLDSHSHNENNPIFDSKTLLRDSKKQSESVHQNAEPNVLKPSEDDIVAENESLLEIMNRSRPAFNADKTPETAYELSRKIRAEESDQLLFHEAVDSKGFRTLKNQVADFSKLPHDIIASILRNSVVYNDHDIVAIDKPYGIPTQQGTGIRFSIDSLLPQVSKLLGLKQPLLQLHRLDKNTTGVMLFAKSKETQKLLIQKFRDHEIRKRYWVLTKGVPNPEAGIINIPMIEGTIQGKYRMILKPNSSDFKLVGKRTRRETSTAITKFRIIHSSNSVALVECEPVTGVKHQVRCHLGFGLKCPVLGDHKYSHGNKLAPQRLYPETLQHLGIRQVSVRNLPMHLHAKDIFIPKFVDGRNLFISTRLPKHFVKSLKRLRIKTKAK